jgi:hypothetical protein
LISRSFAGGARKVLTDLRIGLLTHCGEGVGLADALGDGAHAMIAGLGGDGDVFGAERPLLALPRPGVDVVEPAF